MVGEKKRLLAEKIVFFSLMAVALLWQLLVINKGIDVTDTGFYLSNYKYAIKNLSIMHIGVYFSNVVGGLIYSAMPCCQLIVLKLISCLIFDMGIILSYILFRKFMPRTLLALALMVASFSAHTLSTCLSYNTFSVLFIIPAIFLLYYGLTKEKWFYIGISGALIGISVFFRLPNVLFACIFVAVIWYDIFCIKNKKCIRDLLVLLAGGITGIVIDLIIMLKILGINGFIESLNFYMSLGTGDSTHGLNYTVKNLLKIAFTGTKSLLSSYFLIALLAAAALFVILKIFNINKNSKIAWYVVISFAFIGGLIYGAVSFLFAPMTQWAPIIRDAHTAWLGAFFIVYFVINLFSVFYFKTANRCISLLALLSLLLGCVMMVGTDVGLFIHTVVVIAVMMGSTCCCAYNLYKCADENDSGFHFILKRSAALIVAAVVAGGGLIYGERVIHRQFMEEDYSQLKSMVSFGCLKGVKTNKFNAHVFELLNDYFDDESISKVKVAGFGNFPILFSVIDNPNVFNENYWADLSSFSNDDIDSYLDICVHSDNLPIIVIYGFYPDDFKKTAYIESFAKENGYLQDLLYTSDGIDYLKILVPNKLVK